VAHRHLVAQPRQPKPLRFSQRGEWRGHPGAPPPSGVPNRLKSRSTEPGTRFAMASGPWLVLHPTWFPNGRTFASDTCDTNLRTLCCIRSCRLGSRRSLRWRAKRTCDRCRGTSSRNLKSTCAAGFWLGASRVRTAEAAGLRCSWPSRASFAACARRAERGAQARPQQTSWTESCPACPYDNGC
jgi:hypothetical protein